MQPTWPIHNLRGDRISAEEDELGVARGAMRGAEASEVQAGSKRMAAFVSAIPLHLVCASVERCIHERAHALTLDVVDSHLDGGGLAEVEVELGSCVEGVGPDLEGVGWEFGGRRMDDPRAGDAFCTAADGHVDSVGLPPGGGVDVLGGHYGQAAAV